LLKIITQRIWLSGHLLTLAERASAPNMIPPSYFIAIIVVYILNQSMRINLILTPSVMLETELVASSAMTSF